MLEILVPPINTKGNFSFKEPFDTLLKEDVEYTVTSIRSLSDLVNSEEDPLAGIYTASGLTEEDFKYDVENNIPIVVLLSEAGNYYYVPANRITTIPKVEGVRYQDKILAIHLGSLPVIMNLDLLKDVIKQDVYDTIGVDSQIEVVLASAVKLVSKEEDKLYTELLANRSSIDKSYRTLYKETKELLDDREIVITKLEDYIKANCT